MRNTKFFTVLLAILLLPLVAFADSYTSLWKKYEAACAKDHPQTALKVLNDISFKARRERDYGHLLKAQSATIEKVAEISTDSIVPALERMRTDEVNAVKSGNKVVAAIYQSVLGYAYSRMAIYANQIGLADCEETSKEYYRKSMENPDALANAYATNYMPLVVDGVDSKYFYDDMLHIIGQRAGAFREMHDYYASHGKREAACLTAIAIVKQSRRFDDVLRVKKSKYIMLLDSLAREYDDLIVCGEVAIERYEYMENAEDVSAEEKMNYINYALMKWGAWPRMNVLRNAQRRLTLPSYHMSLGGEMALPGVTRNVRVLGLNNIGELKITATRLDIDGTTELNPNNKKDYATLLSHVIAGEQPITDVRRYVGVPAYNTINDTLQLRGLRSGMYLVELTTDNTSVPVERTLLHVCNLYPIVEALPGKRYRIAVLNATTGTPVQAAKIDVVMSKDASGKDVVKTFTTDDNGEAYVEYSANEPMAYRVYTAVETAFPRTRMASAFRYYARNYDVSIASLYTDRSLYRPGQTVNVAAIAYNQDKTTRKAEVAKAAQFNIVLRDANAKEVARKSVTTDDYGMASVDFVLPQSGLTGIYTLSADYGQRSFAQISVEEYKRPTFKVEIEKSSEKYALGDTVRLNASAKSFADIPVQGAKVAVKVVRRPAMFWRFAGSTEKHTEVFSDTIHTSQDGTFVVKVPISVPDTYEDRPQRYYVFDVTADVTNASGETRYAEASLPYSDRPTLLTCDVPQLSVVDSLRTISFGYVNNAGEPISGDVTYTIDSLRYTCKANTRVDLDTKAILSGRHELVAVCGSDTLTTSFVTFSLQDRKSPIQTHDWFYLSADQFPADGSPVYLQLGSSDSIQHVVYTLISGDKVIADGRVDLNNELRTHAINYKEEWGDGVTLSVAWVKSGHSYVHMSHIKRPEPNRNLCIKWKTFRDRLLPGQRETWTLNISNPDGTPAKAQMLATMYDKSLDDIRDHTIAKLHIDDMTSLPWMMWRSMENRPLFAYSEMPVRFLDEPRLDFSHIKDYSAIIARDEVFCASNMLAYKKSNSLSRVALADGMIESADESMGVSLPMASASNDDMSIEDAKSAENVPLRENMQETAFFFPGLVADANGNVTLRFTLPESVTTWRMQGLAHDKDMNTGVISAETVAKKIVMVQPNVPRFVRSADKGVISALVSNTSDNVVSGVARLVFADPQTDKELYSCHRKFTVKRGETTPVNFDFDMTKIQNDGLLVCRVTASGNGYSDGEQHYLPVLPDKELVTNTIAFSQSEPGFLSLDVKRLFDVKDKSNKLTIEYTNSPAWLMIQTLPALSSPSGDNAISLASAYYANALGLHIMNMSPAIKQTISLWKNEKDSPKTGTSLQSALQQNQELKQMVLAETPWLADADGESEQKQLLINYFDESQLDYKMSDIVARLGKLQQGDGSFAWWSGMQGSPSMTMSVVQTFVRLNSMIGSQPATAAILDRAFAYMDKQMAREVSDMQKQEHEHNAVALAPSQTAVQYLYASTLAARKMQGTIKKNFDYLVNHLCGKASQYSIYEKAVAAVVLAKNGHKSEADETLESLRQHTVYNEEMGRYFDSPKAAYSWFDYRIPSQVMTIEALSLLQPQDNTTIAQMQRWLLQSKRTQMWDTPLNTVNAVYAFLSGNVDELVNNNGKFATISLDGHELQCPKSTAGLGYVKMASHGDKFKTVDIAKTSDGISWGAVYAQFMQPVAEVADVASGLKVERQIVKNGVAASADELKLNVGNRVTVRIIVTASRDYDFVQIADNRAACLEPLHQLSGYGNGYYCQMKDCATNYFFDHLSKGRHVIETTYYADRNGTYNSGTCVAQCAYAPEYLGRAKAMTIGVE